MFDILVKDGRIIDGTGRPSYKANIGIQGDTLTILRGDSTSLASGQVIDASGCIVAPGFIDMHSHSDLALLTEPRHIAKISQGVTTEALGMDGLSYAPISQEKLGGLIQYLVAVNGHAPPGIQWSSVKEFLDLFDNRTSCNVVYFVPHAALRIEAMGWEARPANPNELKKMQQLVEQGMKDGAFGFSTGLTYFPGTYSDTNELIEIARKVRPYGGIYITHSRYYLGDQLLDPFKEAISIGEKAGVPIQLSHFHNPVDGMGKQMVELINHGQNNGIDVSFDQYPYPAASTLLLSLVPAWAHAGGPNALLSRIKTRDVREQIKDNITPQWGGGGDFQDYILSRIASGKNKEWEGKSISDLANSKRKNIVDTICDLLIEENLDVAFVARTGNIENISTILQHPSQMFGSDGLLTGGKPNPRSYGTFPYALGQLVREQNILSLEDAVKKMSSIPAKRLGLKDRGAIEDGMKADIVVFNPDTVRAMSTFENPKQLPVGINHVLVNGRIVIYKGEHTGDLPGRSLRKN